MSDAPLSPPESSTGKPIRRRYSVALKRQIVEASLRPGVSAAQVARQYGLNGNLLHTWRWQYRNGLLGEVNEGCAESLDSFKRKLQRIPRLVCLSHNTSHKQDYASRYGIHFPGARLLIIRRFSTKLSNTPDNLEDVTENGSIRLHIWSTVSKQITCLP